MPVGRQVKVVTSRRHMRFKAYQFDLWNSRIARPRANQRLPVVGNLTGGLGLARDKARPSGSCEGLGTDPAQHAGRCWRQGLLA